MTASTELATWLNGTPTGGPNNDGRYPLTYQDGFTYLVYCPAAQALNPSLAEQPIEVFANTATAAASSATTSASVATQAKIDAQTAAANAAASETNALTSKNAAAASATAAGTSATNAAGSATAAAGSATTASGASTTAVTARDKAMAWADNAIDVIVETAKYSAKHWAQKAADSALLVADKFDKIGGTITGLAIFAEGLRIETGKRIFGDFSNGTHASRTMLQTSTTNSSTIVGVIPNGTGTVSALNLYTSSDPGNASMLQVAVDNSSARLTSTLQGTGTTRSLVLAAGSASVTLDPAGNTATSSTLAVNGSAIAFGAKMTVHSAGGSQCSLNLWQAGIGTGQIGFLPSDSTMYLRNCYTDGTLAGGAGIAIDVGGCLGIGGAPINNNYYRVKVYGGIQSVGAQSQVQFEDRTTGGIYVLYATAGNMHIYNGTGTVFSMSAGGAVTLASSLSVPQSVSSTGTNAGYFFTNRTGTVRTYGWYADGNVVRLNVSGIGDVFSITEGGIFGGPGVSQSTSGNTLVQRNPSGYIFTNYYNMTANDIGAVAAGRVAIETGGDGYLRWQSVANFFGAANTGGINARFRDMYCDRGDGTGVVFLNGAGTRYLYWNGSSYTLPSGPLSVGGDISGAAFNTDRLNVSNSVGSFIYGNGSGIQVNGAMYQNGASYQISANSAAWVRNSRTFSGTTVDINQMSDGDVFFELP